MTAHIQTVVYPPEIQDAKRLKMRRSVGEMTFDPRIAIELAAQLRDPVEILDTYGYSGRNAFNLVASPLFQAELKAAIEQSVQGLTFRQRAKLMAPDVLEHAYDMATDKDISAAVRLDAQKWIAKMADLEPKEDKSTNNNAFQLVINMAG